MTEVCILRVMQVRSSVLGEGGVWGGWTFICMSHICNGLGYLIRHNAK